MTYLCLWFLELLGKWHRVHNRTLSDNRHTTDSLSVDTFPSVLDVESCEGSNINRRSPTDHRHNTSKRNCNRWFSPNWNRIGTEGTSNHNSTNPNHRNSRTNSLEQRKSALRIEQNPAYRSNLDCQTCRLCSYLKLTGYTSTGEIYSICHWGDPSRVSQLVLENHHSLALIETSSRRERLLPLLIKAIKTELDVCRHL